MKIQSFTVLPDTPAKLKHLNELAYNLYFSWHKDVTELFKKLCRVSWEASNCNPARMLCLVPQEKLNQAANNEEFLAELEEVYGRLQDYLNAPGRFDNLFEETDTPQLAYFCAEFGLHECLPVYSGGLGVLAGDHIKSASDLGIPMIGVGLLYRQGYFRQYLNAEGMQQEQYPENDWYSMPVALEKDEYGTPIKSSIDLAGRPLWFQIWRVDVGRCCIYLLDTNVDDNPGDLKDITKMLYDPDRPTRIRQELLLGIGGIQALRALGIYPKAYHVNEGHSAFMLLERIRLLMEEDGLTYEEAKEVVWATSVFTTHTPVPAGNERFAPHLMEEYFREYHKKFGLDWESFMALGRENPYDSDECFCMTVLALRLAAYANGVSRLHGQISRRMWGNLYPGIPEDEIPIDYVTNGVHSHSWINPLLKDLILAHAGDDANEPNDLDFWQHVDQIPDEELWQLRKNSKKDLIQYVRERVRWQLLRRGARAGELSKVHEILDPDALTIGFARRVASYKRAYLFLMNPERLKQIFCDVNRPVQIIVAGKAHPADHSAKEIIRDICEIANQPEFRTRIVFLEDYEISMARHLVQGVDLWLNTPRRPLEASGTSGMKCAINGALNQSVLDGWWDEAFSTDYGWAIGQGEVFDDHELQDHIESDLFYGALEREIVPLFYDRDSNGIPRGWLKMVKRSIRSLGTEFNSHRMLDNYARRYYHRMLISANNLAVGNFECAKDLAAWRKKIERLWHSIEIIGIEAPSNDFIYKGTELEVKARLKLFDVKPESIIVECYHGPLDAHNQIKHPQRVRMCAEGVEADVTVFSTRIPCTRGGHYGYTVRVLPGHENLSVEFLPGLMKWLD